MWEISVEMDMEYMNEWLLAHQWTRGDQGYWAPKELREAGNNQITNGQYRLSEAVKITLRLMEMYLEHRKDPEFPCYACMGSVYHFQGCERALSAIPAPSGGTKE